MHLQRLVLAGWQSFAHKAPSWHPPPPSTGRSGGLTVSRTLQPLTHREVGGSDSDSAAAHPQGGDQTATLNRIQRCPCGAGTAEV